MTTRRPPHSGNPAAFARSLKDRIRNETTRRGRTTEQLRREFFLQRFLARVFCAPGQRWLLKGGASLLVRRPDARYSQDIDLLHTSAPVTEALAELAAIADAGSGLDPFRFVFDPPRLMTGTALQRESLCRAMALPTAMTRPAASWDTGYAKIARTVPGLPEHTRRIDGALRTVGNCLDPLLGGHLDTGSWDPSGASWSHPGTF